MSNRLEVSGGDQFVKDFFNRPTVAEMEELCRYEAEENPEIKFAPGYGCPYRYDPKKLHRYFEASIRSYFDHLEGPIHQEIARRFILEAHVYAERQLQFAEYMVDAEKSARYERISALIRQPEFVADACAVSVLLQLKDLKEMQPWYFETWSTGYKEDGYQGLYFWSRTQTDPRFGADQIEGLTRIIGTRELWHGECYEMRRQFFCSVAHVLSGLSNQKGLLLETLWPRIELLTLNKMYGKHHEVECCSGFRPGEISILRDRSRQDESVRNALRLIERFELNHRPHAC